MSVKIRTDSRGVFAIAMLAAIYGLTAVMARYLSHGVGLFEQWYLRYALGFVLSLVLFRKQVDFHKFGNLPAREWTVLLFRTFFGSVIGIALYTIAAQKAKIGPVAFMQVLPTTALFGVILLHEKLSLKKTLLICLSFAGAVFVAVENIHDLASFNIGELWSLVSGALFSLVLIARKWHTGKLNNYEITVAISGLSFIMNYLLSICLYRRALIPASHWTASFAEVLIIAGALSVAMNFLSNYGFEHMGAVLASSLLDLELVFGAAFGYVFYRESLNAREIAGGLIILVAAILMNQLTKREQNTPSIVIPD